MEAPLVDAELQLEPLRAFLCVAVYVSPRSLAPLVAPVALFLDFGRIFALAVDAVPLLMEFFRFTIVNALA